MRVAVAMSGGVDSSVAAYLLREQGHEVVGVTLRLLDRGDAAAADAALVALCLGIEHHVLEARAVFEQRVLSPFVTAYRNGYTPNPCVICNRTVKFGWLREQCARMQCASLATGHYVRVDGLPGARRLLRAIDPQKDQSYFLVPTAAEVLDHLVFPLGELTKNEVREIAARVGIPVATKAESQDACFIPPDGLQAFLAARGLGGEGDIVTADGSRLGSHRGIHGYTVGQRKGLGVAATVPMYVVRKDAEHNRLVVGSREMLLNEGLRGGDAVWLPGSEALFQGDFVRCGVKIRSTAKDVPCRVRRCGKEVEVYFDSPQFAVAPGQMAVFYQGDSVLGGAWIEGPLPGEGDSACA